MLNKLSKTKLLLITFSLLFLLATTIPATASEGHGEGHHEIHMDDLPYTSEEIILEWGENITFEFEIHTHMKNITFEIIDLDGSLFGYEFEHEHSDEHEDNPIRWKVASEGHENDTEWETAEGLPRGSHLDGHVVRHVTFEETGNYSVLVSNEHDHPELTPGADTVSFKIKMSSDHSGVENMGASWNEPTDAVPSPGYEFFFVVLALVFLPVIIRNFRRK
jgi:hypothetical protein